MALIKSINTVPVRLAKDHLTIPPIKAMAEAMGVESPLENFKTMVLGTSGMTVMDQATGYNVFANGGYAGTRHGVTQLLSHAGKVIYDFDNDGPKPKRVLSEKALSEMNSILVRIPEIGTARRAARPAIRSAGKTGTTQNYRDAWYVGFTGNYTAAVWMGNDDFSPTRNMTGGLLPAMVWQRLMTYAHQNIDLKPIPGIVDPFVDATVAAKAIEAEKKAAQDASATAPQRPPVLSSATTRTLREINEIFRTAPALEAPAEPKKLSAL
jgi:penicillin-binding protein 1A